MTDEFGSEMIYLSRIEKDGILARLSACRSNISKLLNSLDREATKERNCENEEFVRNIWSMTASIRNIEFLYTPLFYLEGLLVQSTSPEEIHSLCVINKRNIVFSFEKIFHQRLSINAHAREDVESAIREEIDVMFRIKTTILNRLILIDSQYNRLDISSIEQILEERLNDKLKGMNVDITELKDHMLKAMESEEFNDIKDKVTYVSKAVKVVLSPGATVAQLIEDEIAPYIVSKLISERRKRMNSLKG